MKVRATKVGYHGHLREEGSVFELKDIEYKDADGKKQVHSAENQFSETWMEKVGKKNSKQIVEKDESEDEEESKEVEI